MSHIGTSVDLEYNGKNLHVSLLQNPSHLEAVNPVALGKTRAKQTEMNDNKEGNKVMCVLFHGDAAMYGQGVVAESFALARLRKRERERESVCVCVWFINCCCVVY